MSAPVDGLPPITTTTCPGRDDNPCGARIDGTSDHYWCPICGWVSPPDQPASQPSE